MLSLLLSLPGNTLAENLTLLALWRSAQSISLAYKGGSPALPLKEPGNYSIVTSLGHQGSLYRNEGALSLPWLSAAPEAQICPKLSWAPISLMSALSL